MAPLNDLINNLKNLKIYLTTCGDKTFQFELSKEQTSFNGI